MRATVGFVGIPEHAARSAEHAALAGIPPPTRSLAALATYHMTFGGDSARAIEEVELAAEAARAVGDDYQVVNHRCTCLTYTALLAPGTDETLRYAEEVRRDVVRLGSVPLQSMWLQAMAVALLPVDRERSIALLDEAVELAARSKLREGLGTGEFWRGLVLFTLRRYADSATAWRRSLVSFHDLGNRRGMTNVLSGVTGLADRTGRSEAAVLLLIGLRAARDEFGLRGSANERYAEQRIEEHLHASTGADGAALEGRQLDIEATIDLALDTLDEIAADASTEIA